MAEFHPQLLTADEQRVLDAVARGAVMAFRADQPRPVLRGTFLRHLLLGLPARPDGADWALPATGVRIRHARVAGRLDLRDAARKEGGPLPPLVLVECELPDPVDLDNAHIARVSIASSSFRELRAGFARLTGSLDFRHCHPVDAEAGARVLADGIQVEGDVFGVRAVLSATAGIPGQPRGDALALQNARIAGSVLLPSMRVSGCVSLIGARIGGGLECDGAKLHNRTRDGSGTALIAQRTEIGGGALFGNGFDAMGRVSLLGARISGNLEFAGAKIGNRTRDGSGTALNAEGIHAGGAVLLRDGFEAAGRVTLLGARIVGDLDCSKAKLRNRTPDGNADALTAENAEIGGDVQLRDLRAEGRVSLRGSRVGADVIAIGAWLLSPGGDALRASNLEVGDNVLLRRTTVLGGINLSRASIGTVLAWDELRFPLAIGQAPGVRIAYTNENPDLLFDLSHTNIGAALQARSMLAEVAGHLDLQGLRVGSLDDDWNFPDGWGGGDNPWTLKLDGFSYDRINLMRDGDDTAMVDKRIAWLKRQDNYRPQPYQQLAKVLRVQGHTDAARKIAIAGFARAEMQNPFFRVLWWLWGFLFGYGLAPGRAALVLLGTVAIGTMGVCQANYVDKVMVLSTGNSLEVANSGGQPVYPRHAAPEAAVELHCGNQISALLYAIDTMLPVIPLHQQSKCEISTEPDEHKGKVLTFSVATWRYLFGGFSILGKVIATLALITFAGIVRLREEG